jgi:hypothetical protein
MSDYLSVHASYHAAIPAGRCQAWVANLAKLPLAEVGGARVHSGGGGGSVDVLLLCFVCRRSHRTSTGSSYAM